MSKNKVLNIKGHKEDIDNLLENRFLKGEKLSPQYRDRKFTISKQQRENYALNRAEYLKKDMELYEISFTEKRNWYGRKYLKIKDIVGTFSTTRSELRKDTKINDYFEHIKQIWHMSKIDSEEREEWFYEDLKKLCDYFRWTLKCVDFAYVKYSEEGDGFVVVINTKWNTHLDIFISTQGFIDMDHIVITRYEADKVRGPLTIEWRKLKSDYEKYIWGRVHPYIKGSIFNYDEPQRYVEFNGKEIKID